MRKELSVLYRSLYYESEAGAVEPTTSPFGNKVWESTKFTSKSGTAKKSKA